MRNQTITTQGSTWLRAICVLAVTMLVSPSLFALSNTWDGGSSNNGSAWLSTTNWITESAGSFVGSTGSGGSANVTSNTDIATFTATGTGSAISGTAGSVGINVNFTGSTIGMGAISIAGRNRFFGASTTISGTVRFNGATVNSTANVILQVVDTSTLTLQSPAGNTGSMTYVLGNSTNNIIRLDGTNSAVVISSVLGQGSGGAKNLTISGTGTGGRVVLSNVNTYSGTTTITAGTLVLSGTGTAGTGSMKLDGGALDLSTYTGNSGTYVLSASQVLSGTGAIRGAAGKTLSVTGTFAPGTSPGTVTLDTVNLSLSGTTTFEFTSTNLGLGTYDLVQGTAGGGTESVTFGGGLTVNFSGGTYAPFTVKIFDVNSYSGSFSTFSYTGLDVGQTASFNPLTGEITVVPEPQVVLLVGTGLASVLFFRRRRS